METTEARLQTAFGQILALNNAVAALMRAQSNKDVIETALNDFEIITADILKFVEQNYPNRGQEMLETYRAQAQAFRQALRPST